MSSTALTPVFPWLPPAGRTASRPAGVAWDAVAVPEILSERVFRALAPWRGAVIADVAGGVHYWLVRAGAAEGWDVPSTAALGVDQYVTVPAADLTAGPLVHWFQPPVHGRTLTDDLALRVALMVALTDDAWVVSLEAVDSL